MNDQGHIHYLLRVARDRAYWMRRARFETSMTIDKKRFYVDCARRCNRLIVGALKRY